MFVRINEKDCLEDFTMTLRELVAEIKKLNSTERSEKS